MLNKDCVLELDAINVDTNVGKEFVLVRSQVNELVGRAQKLRLKNTTNLVICDEV